MSKLSKLIGVVIVILGLILLPIAITLSQEFCVGNFDYDKDVDGTDATNFKSDFGRSALSNPCPPDGPSPVTKTGRTVSFETGDDGDLERGLPWPMPRFTDNGNGTVTDNLTGLIWMKFANCFGVRTWSAALSDCQSLASGDPWCGLNDGSSAGDWRLPNRFELESLLDLDYRVRITTIPSTTTTIWPIPPPNHVPIPNTAGDGPWSEGDPFTNIRPYEYWSSTTTPDSNDLYSFAWWVEFSKGVVSYSSEGVSNYVWCVRGGH